MLFLISLGTKIAYKPENRDFFSIALKSWLKLSKGLAITPTFANLCQFFLSVRYCRISSESLTASKVAVRSSTRHCCSGSVGYVKTREGRVGGRGSLLLWKGDEGHEMHAEKKYVVDWSHAWWDKKSNIILHRIFAWQIYGDQKSP